MGQFLLLPVKMLLLLSCLAATSLASPLQFERVPILNNRIPLLVQERVPNPCLTKANDTCIFPFTYNGVEYYRCTYADSPTPWCATMVDPNNTVVTNRWGDCSTSQFSNCPEDTPDLPSCTAESGASCVFPFRHEGITYNSCASTDLLSSASTTTAAADLRRTCTTVSGPASGKPCVFPFTWQGKTFTSCTKEGDDQGKLWCSTMVDQAGNHVAGQGQYGFCSQTCNQGLRRV